MDISEEELGEIGRSLFVSSLLASVTPDDPQNIIRWCEANGEPYTDNDFPPIFNSLIKNPDTSPKTKRWSKFVWRRATQFLNPESLQLFHEGIHTDDIRQGALGDCYFLSALACLAETPKRILQLFLTQKANQQGVYGIKLNVHGLSKTVVVDDYFPCGTEESGPCFSRAVGDQLWVMVMEKAWAKVYGSYQRIENGTISDTLRDLTGAPSEVVKMNDESIWEKLTEATRNNFIISASAGGTKGSKTLLESMGLVGANSYSVMRTFEVTAREGKVKLLKLRNPWGTMEWKGDWSDTSDKWTPKLKKQLNFTSAADGTFWMSLEDFSQYFALVTINKVDDTFKYSSLKCGHRRGEYEVIRVIVPRRGRYYFSINQKQRNCMSKQLQYEYSPAKMIIALQNNRNQLEYVVGVKTTPQMIRNLWTEVELEAGSYQIYVQIDWTSKFHDYVFSVYGQYEVDFTRLRLQPNFLTEAYKTCAVNYGKPTTYQNEGMPGCVKYHGIMPEGFGFFYFQNNSRDITFNEKCYFKKFKNLELLPPYSGAKYAVSVPPGQDLIILMKRQKESMQGLGNQETQLMRFTCVSTPGAGVSSIAQEAKANGNIVKRKDPRSGVEIDIDVTTYKHDAGICFFYENNTGNKTLDETITFKMTGLQLVGLSGDSVNVILGPGQTRLVELRSISPNWNIQTSISYSISQLRSY